MVQNGRNRINLDKDTYLECSELDDQGKFYDIVNDSQNKLPGDNGNNPIEQSNTDKIKKQLIMIARFLIFGVGLYAVYMVYKKVYLKAGVETNSSSQSSTSSTQNGGGKRRRHKKHSRNT